jgi:hypothetical protein
MIFSYGKILFYKMVFLKVKLSFVGFYLSGKNQRAILTDSDFANRIETQINPNLENCFYKSSRPETAAKALMKIYRDRETEAALELKI